MSAALLKLLLLEDNAGDARLVQLALAEHASGEFETVCVGRLADALARLGEERFDAALCDLSLPDSKGLATALAIIARAPALPLVVLTGSRDEKLGREAIQRGAQDYLVKTEAGGPLLARTLGYAIERKALQSDLRAANEALERRVAERTAELEAALARLRESEARFRSLSEMSSDFYWESDAEHRLTQRASADEKVSSVSVFQQGAQIGQRRWEVPYLSPDEAVWQAHRALLDARLPFRNFELSRAGIDGSERHISISGDPVTDDSGAFLGYRGVGSDITARRNADAKIHRLTQLYAALSQCNEAIVRCTSEAELFSQICRAAVQYGGMRTAWIGLADPDTRRVCIVASSGEGAAEILHDIEISADAGNPFGRGSAGTAIRENRPIWCQDYVNDPLTVPWRERGARGGWAAVASLPLRRNEVAMGVFVLYSGVVNAFDEPTRDLLVEMAANVSFALDHFAHEAERKLAQEALRESERRYRVMFESNPHPMWVYDLETLSFLAVNDAAIERYGWSRAEFFAMTIADIRPPEDILRLHLNLAQVRNGTIDHAGVWKHRRKDGTLLDVEITSHGLEFAGRRAKMVLAFDVTGRRQAETALRAAEEQFRGLVEQSIAGIYLIQDGRFAYLNPRFAEIFGYASADELIGRDSLCLVVESDHARVAENMRLRTDGEEHTSSYTFTALRRDGSAIEVGVHGARATHQGRPAVIGLIQDISEKKRAEEQIQRYVAQLESAFMRTVEVATRISEMRDPYTAGHEKRVGEIAVAIGAELGFDSRRQEGLRVAGYLHDIGKITIPAEILAKPGKLSRSEFELIKGHPRASYDVLKSVEFPWPVAEVALQHHERLDGSGYPQGLKGEAILLEARILAVADVMEAMSSHRPHRPAFAVREALAEIERGSGSSYDAAVVDACVRLFRDKDHAVPA